MQTTGKSVKLISICICQNFKMGQFRYFFTFSDFHLKCQNQYEGLQWGRPGPGGVYWRESAVTGQKFFDKMVREISFRMNYGNYE